MICGDLATISQGYRFIDWANNIRDGLSLLQRNLTMCYWCLIYRVHDDVYCF